MPQKRRESVHRALRRYRTSRLPDFADALRRIPMRTAIAGAITVAAVWLVAGVATGFQVDRIQLLGLGGVLAAPVMAALAALQYGHLHAMLEEWLMDNAHVVADMWPALEALELSAMLDGALGAAPGSTSFRVLQASGTEFHAFARGFLRALAQLDKSLLDTGSCDLLARRLTGVERAF